MADGTPVTSIVGNGGLTPSDLGAVEEWLAFNASVRRAGERKGRLSFSSKGGLDVAKMASHAIFQYNVLAIDDTHNTWTNIIVKMTILRLLCSSDDKLKIGVARLEGPPLLWFRQNRDNLLSPVEPTIRKLYSPVQ